MKKLLDYYTRHKKILLIAVLLAAFIILAFVLYGSKSKITSASGNDVDRSVTEIKLMRILSEIDGVGQAEVMINEGDILNAVATALNVEKNNIAIYAMNK